MNKQTTKAPDGGPTPEQVAARAIGGGQTSVRGGDVADAAKKKAAGRYEVTEPRSDGLPLPPGAAPDPHGGHYLTAEDREKYKFVNGYDSGLAPGYDPTFEQHGLGDERGKAEVREWTPPGSEPRQVLINRNHNDGSQSMSAIFAVDPGGNVVKVAPNTQSLKAGWRWATASDLNDKAEAEATRRKQEDAARAEAEKNPPKPAPAPTPAPVVTETAEVRQAREERDPALQAELNGASKSDAEKMVQASPLAADHAKADAKGKDKK